MVLIILSNTCSRVYFKDCLSTANGYHRMLTRIVSIITLSRLLFNRTQHGIQAPSTPVWLFVRRCNETTNRCHVTFSLISIHCITINRRRVTYIVRFCLISIQRQQQLLYYITGENCVLSRAYGPPYFVPVWPV